MCTGFPWLGVLRRLRPTRAFGRHRAYPHHLPPSRGPAAERPRADPTFTADRLTGEAPGCTPAASPRLRRRPSPWPPSPGIKDPTRSSPPTSAGRYAPQTSPDPPGSSWRDFKRRNNTGFSRIPSRLAHRARPIRQFRTVTTLSGLLPPFPTTLGLGCPQLQPAATTTDRRWPFTSVRHSSASWRTR
jgi:hypothetical protein